MCGIDSTKKDVATLLNEIRRDIKSSAKYRDQYQAEVDRVQAIHFLERTAKDDNDLNMARSVKNIYAGEIKAMERTIETIKEIFADYIEEEENHDAAA